MVGRGVHELVDDSTHPDEEAGDRAREAAWQDHIAPLVTPDPSHMLIRSSDGGGLRYFLDGRPAHADSGVELLLSEAHEGRRAAGAVPTEQRTPRALPRHPMFLVCGLSLGSA